MSTVAIGNRPSKLRRIATSATLPLSIHSAVDGVVNTLSYTSKMIVGHPVKSCDKIDRSVGNPKESLEKVENKAAEIDYLKRQRASINKVDQLIEEAEQSLKELRKEFYQTSKELQSSTLDRGVPRSGGPSNVSTKLSAFLSSKSTSASKRSAAKQRSPCSQGENTSLYDEDQEKEVGSIELSKTNRAHVLTFHGSRSSMLKRTHSATNDECVIPTDYIEPTPTDTRRFINAKNSIYLKMGSGSDITFSDSEEFIEDKTVKIIAEPISDLPHPLSEHSEAQLVQALREAGIADSNVESGSKISSNIGSTDFSKKTPPPSSVSHYDALPVNKGSSVLKTRERKLAASTPEITKVFSSKTVIDRTFDGSAMESSRTGVKKSSSGKSDLMRKCIGPGGLSVPLSGADLAAIYCGKMASPTKKAKRKPLCPNTSECRILGLCPPEIANSEQTRTCSPARPPLCTRKFVTKKNACSHLTSRGICRTCTDNEADLDVIVSKDVETCCVTPEEKSSKSSESLKRKVKSQESMTRSPKKCCFAEPEVQEMCCPCPEDAQVVTPTVTTRSAGMRMVTSHLLTSKTVTPNSVISKTVEVKTVTPKTVDSKTIDSKMVTSGTETVWDDKSDVSDLSAVSDDDSCSCNAELEVLRGIDDISSPRKRSSVLKTAEKKSPFVIRKSTIRKEFKEMPENPTQDDFISEVSKIARAYVGQPLTESSGTDATHLNTISEKTEATSEDASQITDEILGDKPKQLTIQHLPQLSIRPPLVLQKVFEIDIKPTGSVELQIPTVQNICYEEVLHVESNEEPPFENLPPPVMPVTMSIPIPPIFEMEDIEKADYTILKDKDSSPIELESFNKANDANMPKSIGFKAEESSSDLPSQSSSVKPCLKDCETAAQMNKIKSNVSFAMNYLGDSKVGPVRSASEERPKEMRSITPPSSNESIRSLRGSVHAERPESKLMVVEGGSITSVHSQRLSGIPLTRSRTFTGFNPRTPQVEPHESALIAQVPSVELKQPSLELKEKQQSFEPKQLLIEPNHPPVNYQRRPTASEIVADILESHHRTCGCSKHGPENEADLIVDENLDDECKCHDNLTNLVPSDHFKEEEPSAVQLSLKQRSEQQLKELEDLNKKVADSSSALLKHISQLESQEAKEAEAVEIAKAAGLIQSAENAETSGQSGELERSQPYIREEPSAESISGKKSEDARLMEVNQEVVENNPRISEVQMAEKEMSIKELEEPVGPTNSQEQVSNEPSDLKSDNTIATSEEKIEGNGGVFTVQSENSEKTQNGERATPLFTEDPNLTENSVVPKSISQYFSDSTINDSNDKKEAEMDNSESPPDRQLMLSSVSPYMFGFTVKAQESLPSTDEVVKKALSDVDKDLLSIDKEPTGEINCDCICKTNQLKVPVPALIPTAFKPKPPEVDTSNSSQSSEKSVPKGKKNWLRRSWDAKRVSIVSQTQFKSNTPPIAAETPSDPYRTSTMSGPSDPSLPWVELTALKTESLSTSSLTSSNNKPNKKGSRALVSKKVVVNHKPSTSEESIYVVMHDVSTQVSLDSGPSECSRAEKKSSGPIRVTVVNDSKKSKKKSGYSTKKKKVKSKDQEQQSQVEGGAENSETPDEVDAAESCRDEPPNSCVTMQPVSVQYETKGVQKSLEDWAFPYVKLHKLCICDDDSSSTNEMSTLANLPIRNTPFGDTTIRPDFISMNLCPMAADLRQMEPRQAYARPQEPRPFKVFKPPICACSSSSDTKDSRLEESLSDGEIKCRCSVSSGELHICYKGNEVKAKAAYLKKHPEVLLRREFPGEDVILKRHRAIYDNWVTFYSAKISPVTTSSSDTSEKSTDK